MEPLQDLDKMKEEAKTSKPVIDLAKVEDIKNRETQKYLDKARRNSGVFSDASDVSSSTAAKRASKRTKTDSESAPGGALTCTDFLCNELCQNRTVQWYF